MSTRRRPSVPDTKSKTVRCAIYTRKSTTEGLEQEFNSLDAQRDAGEAYIQSQRHEGWVCLPDRYDDGGFSGGDMERPALKRLLADIEAGKLDCIICYKIDRLTRSLRDFARIVDVLERHRVSFIAVTQALNTSTAMGRLCLNVLLSFAEFEREQTAERTRDKVAAAKRKGRWTGGMPPLGYDVAPEGGRLVVNEQEAARVRALFDLYVELQSLTAVIAELDRRGWVTKEWTTREGRKRTGQPFNRTTLHRLLTNRTYLGKVEHGDTVYAGRHEAGVEDTLFEQVQQLLQRNARTGGREVRNKHGALLRGLLYCMPCKATMTHTYTVRPGGRRYRYYCCAEAMRRGWAVCPAPSLPAPDVEKFVVDHIRAVGRDPDVLAESLRRANAHVEARLVELNRERQSLEQETRRDHEAIRRATARRPAATQLSPTRLADLQDRLRQSEPRLEQLRVEIDDVRDQVVDSHDLALALGRFEPIWSNLSTREQTRAIRLLVERVAYDGDRKTLAVTFRPTGIRSLVAQAATTEATS